VFDVFFQHIKPAIRVCIKRPAIVLLVGIIAAAIGLILALNISIDNDFAKLIPHDYPSVQALDRLQEQVGTAHEVAVVLQSSSFETNREFAELLIPRAMQLVNRADSTPYFNRYSYRTDRSFLESNALWLATDEELTLIETFLDEEIAYARLQANPFYFDLGDDSAVSDSLGEELSQRYDDLVGSEYPISADSLTMAIRFYPAGSQTDLDYIREVYSELDQLITQQLNEFGESDISFVLAGQLLRTLIEVDTIYLDVRNSFAAGTSLLVFLVMAYFFYKNYTARAGGRYSKKVLVSELIRLPVSALVIVLPLALSLCWTFGIAWLLFETLNVMTATLGLLLFGMGIDFGIHFYARYAEERSKARTVPAAIETTFMTTGQAITAVGVTTSAAFFILMVADFKGFSEFGAIAGIGILLSIITMIFLMPALIVLLEKSTLLKTSGGRLRLFKNGRQKISANSRQKIKIAAIILVVCIGLTGAAGVLSDGVSFEYDFSQLEPDYESYERVKREARKVYSDRKTRNAAYIIADSPEDAIRVRDVIQNRIESDSLTPTIASVEILQDRLPMTADQQDKKLQRLESIRERLNDPFLRLSDSDQLERLERAASTQSPVPIDSIPSLIIDPFTASDGSIGNLVIVYPGVGLSDGRNSMNFAADLSDIQISSGTTYTAGSTSIVASDMLRLMIEEAPLMIALTLTFIIILKLFIFRSLKWTLLVLIPLVASFLWIFGVMDLAGWKLNFYNIVVLPTILGIGDDSGIHILHRYLEEGKGSVKKVLRSTGEHITVSSLTTMVGFAGLLLSNHPGLRSIGELAVTGIGLMLLASLVMLPALLILLEPWIWRKQKNEGPSKHEKRQLST
jgi:hypothetical protein